jgi:hypothetical protein
VTWHAEAFMADSKRELEREIEECLNANGPFASPPQIAFAPSPFVGGLYGLVVWERPDSE